MPCVCIVFKVVSFVCVLEPSMTLNFLYSTWGDVIECIEFALCAASLLQIFPLFIGEVAQGSLHRPQM